MNKFSLIILICAVIIGINMYLKRISNDFYEELFYRWDSATPNDRIKLDVDDISFPNEFLWGVSTAAHQIEGNHTSNNWSKWEETPNNIHTNDKCGKASNHWHMVDEDIDLMENLGVNSYRFSISWSKLMPTETTWDQSVIDHYNYEINALLSKNIIPMITLHHFTEPLWFHNKGAFEKYENVRYFVEFSRRVFTLFHQRVKYWCIINEMIVYVLGGYVDGVFPPGLKYSSKTGTVLLNLLRAHVDVYYALKDIDTNVKIGMVKSLFQLDPMNPLNPLDVYIARACDYAYNGAIIEFFRTGVYDFRFHGLESVYYEDRQHATTSYDFVGLNYYSHYQVEFISLFKDPPFLLRYPRNTADLTSDMPQRIYARGIYRALKQLSVLNKPLYVTENGIADYADDRRMLYIRRYLYAISDAIKDGMDVRGYFYWSLMDNFEWAEGYSMRFGLYRVDFEHENFTRTLTHGGKFYRWIVRSHRQLPLVEEDARVFALIKKPKQRL